MNFVPHPEFRPFSVADKPPLKTTTIEPTTVNGSRMHTSAQKPGRKTTTIDPAAGRTRLRDREYFQNHPQEQQWDLHKITPPFFNSGKKAGLFCEDPIVVPGAVFDTIRGLSSGSCRRQVQWWCFSCRVCGQRYASGCRSRW